MESGTLPEKEKGFVDSLVKIASLRTAMLRMLSAIALVNLLLSSSIVLLLACT